MIEGHFSLAGFACLGLAVGMALFMGVAFEGFYKREERSSPGGIRTFPLLTLLGATFYQLDAATPWAFLLGIGAVAAWLCMHIAAELRASTLERPGLVVPIANLLAYSFGPLALTQPPWLVIAVAVLAALLLEGRATLHSLVLKIPAGEIFTLAKFLILVGVVLPLLPNEPVTVWTRITPFQAWLALIAVSTISYASYLAQRYWPASRSRFLMTAVFGGIYSSTVTTVALARQKLADDGGRAQSLGIVAATGVMYLRIEAITAFFNGPLALALLPGLASLTLLAVVMIFADWRRTARAESNLEASLPTPNPLQIGTAIGFSVLFIVISILAEWMQSQFGASGVLGLAAISGVTDIDPLIVSLAQGAASLTLSTLAAAVLLAAASNNVLKAAYAFGFGGRRTLRSSLQLLALGVAGIGIALLMLKA